MRDSGGRDTFLVWPERLTGNGRKLEATAQAETAKSERTEPTEAEGRAKERKKREAKGESPSRSHFPKTSGGTRSLLRETRKKDWRDSDIPAGFRWGPDLGSNAEAGRPERER